MSGAKDFAAALFSLSEELGITERVLLDVEASRQALLDNPEYSSLVDTPAISISEKIELIDKAFADVDEILRNLIKILCEKHSVYIFPAVAKEYCAIYNEARGICQAEAISAYPLSESHMAALKEKLEKMTGKTIALKNTIDTSILGGVKLRYMGKQLDASVRSRLDKIEAGLKETVL